MKITFTILLHLLIHSLLFFSCEDPSIEEFAINETKESNFQASEEPQKLICYIGEPQAEFPGGSRALLDFIKSNLQYPEAARGGFEGTVWAGCTVNEDGTLSDFHIRRGLHPDLDAEAIRVLKLMPNWIPGKENGHPVRILYTIPVKFKLTE